MIITSYAYISGKVTVLVSDTDSVAKTDVNVGPSDCVRYVLIRNGVKVNI